KIWPVQDVQSIPQLVKVPVLDITRSSCCSDIISDSVSDHGTDIVLDIGCFQNLTAGCVDNLALLVEDLVVLENVLTHLKVLVLNLCLRALNGIGHHLGVNRNIIWNIQAVHHVFHGLANETHHELITHGQV